jgi:hypothetical protein
MAASRGEVGHSSHAPLTPILRWQRTFRGEEWQLAILCHWLAALLPDCMGATPAPAQELVRVGIHSVAAVTQRFADFTAVFGCPISGRREETDPAGWPGSLIAPEGVVRPEPPALAARTTPCLS